MVGDLLIPKYPGALTELNEADQAGEDAAEPFLRAVDRLEEQRLQEWRAFGEALAERLRAVAPAVLPGLTVPLNITVVVDNGPTMGEQAELDPVGRRLLDAVAFSANGYPPTPADLPGTPLQRLGIDNP